MRTTLSYRDEQNKVWRGPLYCGDQILFSCGKEFFERSEPDPSWVEIDIKEVYMLTSAVVELNLYLRDESDEIEITKDTPVAERARQVAVHAHCGQTRWNKDAYITHPIRVASKFQDPIVKAIAYLHDVVEDTKLTLADLRRFGFCQEILDGIESVTKRNGEPYLDFVLRIKGNIKGRSVKIADIEDNLSDLTDRNKTIRDKYQLALWILERT